MEGSDKATIDNVKPDIDNVKPEVSALSLHEEIMEETSDPSEAKDVGPKWFYVVSLAAIVIGFFYLGHHMGEFNNRPHLGYIPVGMLGSTASKPAAQADISGKNIFVSKCASCHQSTGMGVPGAFPPLVASPYVLGNPEVTARIILHGLHGPIEVEGGQYNGIMPAWGDQLKDNEIAAVINFIRSELGANKASRIDAEFISGVRGRFPDRKTAWTSDELQELEKTP